MTDFGVLLIIAVLVGWFMESAKLKKLDQEAMKSDSNFKSSCVVADEISFIEDRAGNLVLAKCIDGRWGIASSEGWMHLGQAKYISSKWKQYSGRYPYIPFN